MDPNLVYSRYRDDSQAEQVTATKYNVFVAMPFRDRFSYQSRDIYDNLIKPAAVEANKRLGRIATNSASRVFDIPHRADDAPQGARVIDDEIIKSILFSHVVIADLTFANDGVLLEVGAALALKPTNQIILVTQGSLSELHFDIRNNTVIEYSRSNGVDVIARALVATAKHLEEQHTKFLDQSKSELSRDAILTMNWLGRLETGKLGKRRRLHEGIVDVEMFATASATENPKEAQCAEANTRFQLALRELLIRRLLWTDYQPRKPEPGVDSWSYRATRLGWMFIEHHWDDLKCPPDEVGE